MADFLIKAGADIELGCSTPLMEAAQEGHLELVKYLLAAGTALQPPPKQSDSSFALGCRPCWLKHVVLHLNHSALLGIDGQVITSGASSTKRNTSARPQFKFYNQSLGNFSNSS